MSNLVPLIRKSIIPTVHKNPPNNSESVIILNNKGTIFFKGEFEKCPVNQSKFPLWSIILSIPDCKKHMAKNKAIKI